MKPLRSIQILVSGTVQGVGFRWATRQVAVRQQISGSVQNLSDGRVKIIACGSRSQLHSFLTAVKSSPTPYGHVDQIQITQLKSNFNTGSFIVK